MEAHEIYYEAGDCSVGAELEELRRRLEALDAMIKTLIGIRDE